MAKKYYAVKNGIIPGIYETWSECQKQVNGYSGAIFKSFAKREDALAFINGVSDEDANADIPDAYVDGSYNIKTKEFSYGMVIIENGREYTFCERFSDKELADMRNVAGEIKGAEAAMRYACDRHLKEINIYHDYEGIAAWCLGYWKAGKSGTIKYKEYYDSIKDKVKINFIKVKGHSGDKYNDMADGLAKKALIKES